MTKTMSLRLDDKTAVLVEGAAAAEGVTQAEWVRRAIDAHIRTVARTPEFQRRLHELADRQETAVNYLRNLA